MNTAAFKTINYRGGVVRFQIPFHWKEEYEDDGGGTFYAPGDDTGTLRLNVLTFKAPPGKQISASTAPEVLAPEAEKRGVRITSLREGVAMIRSDEQVEENGEALSIRYWRIAQVLPPADIRLVIFSYTILASQLSTPSSAAELDLLDEQIAAAELAPTLGEVPPVRKSWWR